MQLSLSFSFLLTTLLALTQVEAFPVKRSPGIVTLPLKRLPQPSDVHPSVVSNSTLGVCGRNFGIDHAPQLLQQHINRSHRRHARMTGREGPSDTELEKRLLKRLNSAKFPKYEKRYNRSGVKAPSIKGANRLVQGEEIDR